MTEDTQTTALEALLERAPDPTPISVRIEIDAAWGLPPKSRISLEVEGLEADDVAEVAKMAASCAALLWDKYVEALTAGASR